MAAAMGKPVWVLTQYVVDWRWSDGQRESWYPTAKVFSQLSHGDWASVISSIRHELINFKASLVAPLAIPNSPNLPSST
jgi:hypothetical protein